MFKSTSKIRLLRPLNFKGIPKTLKIEHFSFKGCHRKSFEIQRFFKGYIICDLLKLSLKNNSQTEGVLEGELFRFDIEKHVYFIIGVGKASQKCIQMHHIRYY